MADYVTDFRYITGCINSMARDDDLDLCYTYHCKERMEERGLTVLDILNVLKYGDVVDYQGEAQTLKYSKEKIYKYKIEGPYFGREKTKRTVALIILVSFDDHHPPMIKIQKVITSMYRDKI